MKDKFDALLIAGQTMLVSFLLIMVIFKLANLRLLIFMDLGLIQQFFALGMLSSLAFLGLALYGNHLKKMSKKTLIITQTGALINFVLMVIYYA